MSGIFNQKGQAVLLDFAMALFLFMIMWIFITSEFNVREAEAIRANDFGTMRARADYLLEGLVKTRGIPENWETLTLEDASSFGLAKTDRALSEAKLAAFSNFSSDYEGLRERLPLEEYDFFFEFSGIDDVNVGLEPQGNADKVVVQRIVTYKGGVGIAKLTLYKFA
ncbi:MAG: hypothetical protein AABW99_03300 [archaeon]